MYSLLLFILTSAFSCPLLGINNPEKFIPFDVRWLSRLDDPSLYKLSKPVQAARDLDLPLLQQLNYPRKC